MTKVKNDAKQLVEKSTEPDELHVHLGPKTPLTDDAAVLDAKHVSALLEAITRIGGEVCRMRSEVDGLLEQNASLVIAFEKLRNVIEEKGQFSLDDFELACEVLEAPGGQLKIEAVRKISH